MIFLHTSADLLYEFGKVPDSHWHSANLYDGFTRFCVPVFVMLSGALLLGRPHTLPDFVKRRVLRIIGPLLFWSILYIFWNVWHDQALENPNWSSSLIYARTQLLTGSAFHLWYMYMIIGLYLCIPFLNHWILRAKPKEIYYFLGICLFGVLMAQPLLSSFRPAIDLSFFANYMGYLVLGYWLSRGTLNRRKQIIGAGLWLIGSAVAVIGTFLLSRRDNAFNGYFYDYFTPNVILAAIGFFMWIRNSHYRDEGIWGICIRKISANSYGIYLAHILMLRILKSYTPLLSFTHPALTIPIVSFAVLLTSMLAVRLIAALPGGKYISG